MKKYEKYSIGYSKIKCPKFEHFGVRHSFFGRCPYFSGKIDPAPLQKMARTPMMGRCHPNSNTAYQLVLGV